MAYQTQEQYGVNRFWRRLAVTVATTPLVPAQTDYRCVVEAFQISADIGASSSIILQSITGNSVIFEWVADAQDSCSGLWIPVEEDDGLEVVGSGTITDASITVQGRYVHKNVALADSYTGT